MCDDEILAIERAAFAAWPAAEVRALGGWRLRFTHGVTQRGNSVWAGPADAAGAEPPLAERIAGAERFYAERGQPAMFHVSPASHPRELDAALAARGYAERAPTLVQTARADGVLAATPAGAEAACSEAMSEAWFEISGRRGRFAGEATAHYRGIVERLAGRAGFALACDDGVPAAVGLCALAPPWAGISSMLTLPALRSRGLGRAVLRALAAFALARGAPRLFLQVEEENAAAQRLYERSGFRTRYRTVYRRRF
jgi:ribosomal protein S18 acetylase RimI-like enzyme